MGYAVRRWPTLFLNHLSPHHCGDLWQAMYDVPMFLPVATPVDFTAYLPVGDVMNK